MSTSTLTPRMQFREAVALVAAKAKEKLPEAVNGRVESAVKLVLQGDVLCCDDGTVEVGSSDPTRYYKLVGPTCTCTDFVQGKAPEDFCKHVRFVHPKLTVWRLGDGWEGKYSRLTL